MYLKVDVSREIESYIELLVRWNKTINLIGKSTLSELRKRHVEDSMSLLGQIKENESVIDLGSGSGFPGIILNIYGVKNITLIDSDMRKVAFLRHVIMKLNLTANVICCRIEDLSLCSDVLVSRAFASISSTLNYIANFEYKRLLLLKGENVQEEVISALKDWTFDYKIDYHASGTNLLEIMNAKRK
jgi:16S rRNA (guanine527-N7)-methyltransferase